LSSILKALKKLENEVSVKGDIRSSLHPSHSKVPMRKRKPSDPSWEKRVFIIFMILILIVGSGLILIFKPWEKQPAVTKTMDTDAEITPFTSIETKTPAIAQKATPPIMDSEKDDPLNSAVKDAVLADEKIEKERSALFVNTENGPVKTPDVFEQKVAPLQATETSPSTGENEQAPSRMEDNDQFTSIPIKASSESMLELQAIAWSEHPKKRMVVINGHIVHEGDVVEMATIKHIGENEVVFIKEGRTWRQLFRSSSNF